LITMVVVTVSTFVVEQDVTVVMASGDWLVKVSITVTTSTNGLAGGIPPPPVVVVDVDSVETRYPAIPAAETTAKIAIRAPGRIADLVGMAASKPLPI
jgi:hypothetical protein